MSDLRSELLAIRQMNGGRLSPETGVEAVRQNPDQFPGIHSRLEWDDTKAGDLYRQQQFRHIVAKVKINVHLKDKKPASIREFHSIRGDAPSGGGYSYEPLDVIVQDPVMTEVLLTTMRREWTTLKRRYEHFDEFRLMVLGDLTT